MAILERISEAEVRQWFVAKVHGMREAGLPVWTLDMECWWRNYSGEEYYDVGFGGYVCGESVSDAGVRGVLVKMWKKLNGNPEDRAAVKRDRAKALLEEAQELEALSEKLEKRE